MPDTPPPKARAHPARREASGAGVVRGPCAAGAAYAELAVTTNFTFLTGASHPEEFVYRAAELGHTAAAIADRNTLAGIVRAHIAAKEAGIPLAVGCRICLRDPAGFELLAFPTSRSAYARLCTLLTIGKRRAPKGECHLTMQDLIDHQDGLLGIVMPPAGVHEIDGAWVDSLRKVRGVFHDDRLSLGAARTYTRDGDARVRALADIGAHVRIPMAAVNDAHSHIPGRRPLQDVLMCIRNGCSIEEAGYRLAPNAERHLKPGEEMARLFADARGGVARSVEVARRASAFSLDELRYEYPVEPCPPGRTPAKYLHDLAWAGAAERYPGGVPDRVRTMLDHELALIAELRYEPYFLTCADIVGFARSRGILCQGRGGAANSAVCYCLGITEVDPAKFQLLFARFVSRERREPPDIDIDFEHERREEVIQYLYSKYGRDRAALTAVVISYRARSAVREVGKALGLSLDCVDAIAKSVDLWGSDMGMDRLREAGLDPRSLVARQLHALTRQLVGFPRHLSQHVGGFVITRSPLHELVPIENAAMEDRTVIEWDKDDIDAMRMLKVDCLGLGMLTAIRKSFALVKDAGGGDLSIPGIVHGKADDPDVYAMIQRADTVGVFQIESRAQMTMLPRLRPASFYDLVIEVAIVRPGPIQGDMVHPYLRRRTGEEEVTFPSPEIEEVLARTLGVPLFQEQAMQIAIVAAGFTADEADGLRRAMAAWKRKGTLMERYGARLIEGMLANGYPREFAERCFQQLKGFSEYGFPESHAASFALLVYASAWLKHHHPAAFAAALINSQPMGFYQPAQLIRDAQEHGVEARAVDVNRSSWDCTLEDGGRAVRLGMRLAKGVGEGDAAGIADAVRAHGPFADVRGLWRASGASVRVLRALARADAFASMGLERRKVLWAIRSLRDEEMPLFDGLARGAAADVAGADDLPVASARARVFDDYSATGLSLKEHPMAFARERLGREGVRIARDLRSESACPQGKAVRVAGIVLVRQRPGTASGVVFLTLEDETGIANIVVWPKVFERFRRVCRLSVALVVRGNVERQGEVVHVHAREIRSIDGLLAGLPTASRDFH